jgi:hypothetical protein
MPSASIAEAGSPPLAETLEPTHTLPGDQPSIGPGLEPLGAPMRKASGEPFLDRARDAMGRGAWHEAYDLLSTADAEQELDAETLPMLADAAYMTGHPEVSVDAWERIHAAAVRNEDPWVRPARPSVCATCCWRRA